MFVSLIDVTTCLTLAKTTCRGCDIVGSSCPMGYDLQSPYSQDRCYNDVDGITIVMAEYQVDTTECYLYPCNSTTFNNKSRETREVIMMTCASGTYNYNIIIQFIQCTCHLVLFISKVTVSMLSKLFNNIITYVLNNRNISLRDDFNFSNAYSVPLLVNFASNCIFVQKLINTYIDTFCDNITYIKLYVLRQHNIY